MIARDQARDPFLCGCATCASLPRKKKKKRESRHVEADEMLNLDVLRRLAGLELSCRVQTCVSRAGENLARTRAQNPGTRGSAA